MSSNKKNNNRGFSLVELIVVVAIGAILIGASILSIASISGTAAKQCARNIESILNKTRVTTMGKDTAVIELYKDLSDGAYYYTVTVKNGKVDKNGNGETTAETKKIGRSNLEIRYSADVSTTFNNASKLDVSNPIKIEFDRSSGAEKTDISKIWVKHGSTEKTITIYKETGKIECN